MGLFDKAKNFLGVSTVEIELECPRSFSRKRGRVSGTLHLTGLSRQEIKKVQVQLIEEQQSDGDGTYEDVLGSRVLRDRPFSIDSGEKLSLEFSIPFQLSWSVTGELKSKGGFLGAMGYVKEFLSEDQYAYTLVASADVASAALDPKATKLLHLDD